MLQACEAIAEAHARGIVHRDLKPSNLFLTTRADGTPLIKVVDFGVAKSPDVDGDDIVSQWATGKNTILGSPGYMSPEQVQTLPGIDSRTDIWSLGVILYEMLTGEFLFEAPSLAQALAGILMNPKPNLKGAVDVPESLDRLCSWCLEKDRNDRCPNVWEFAFLLVEAARAGTWSKSPRPGIKRGSKPSRLFASKRS